jgi:hypothetical protein
MEEVSENGKESSCSANVNGMNEYGEDWELGNEAEEEESHISRIY